MILNIILMLTTFIFSYSRLSASEKITIHHNADNSTVNVEMVLGNDLGGVRVEYPYESNKYESNKYKGNYILFNFDIKTKKALNLLRVSFNGIEVAHKNLWVFYDTPLELTGKEYLLPFDDSIEFTRFYIYFDPALGEHLKLREMSRTQGLKFDVECVERGSHGKNKVDFSFNFSVDSSKQFFDLFDKFLVN
ncbi:Hypothetical protein BCD_1284 (plasmid) [Borrelia crocidurae DOU]|uniref:Uncharacterized protein n=1 Tax=Borrelia crocidurae DOU TaxID=1293575 RepID=W5SKF8_9SPIR|nr:hypothetical protein [Borrelia crocidurae]AHH07350.1 Hypothetical protein BCD_1284 [Borrelia crocidurae DOU]